MANFKPLKQSLLYLLDLLIEQYGLSGPFLDAGCGLGDVSEHLARRGWSGKAIDASLQSVQQASATLSYISDQVEVKQHEILVESGNYKTIFLFDVLEHVPDDLGLLKHLASLMENGSHLLISVPVFKHEWRWDDRFYGHVRRYEIEEIQDLLSKAGFAVITIWDFTFPVFWLMRRVYTHFLKPGKQLGGPAQQTLDSARQYAWGKTKLVSLIEKLPLWVVVIWFQSLFKSPPRGAEVLILATKLQKAQ